MPAGISLEPLTGAIGRAAGQDLGRTDSQSVIVIVIMPVVVAIVMLAVVSAWWWSDASRESPALDRV